METHWTTIGMFWVTFILGIVTITATVINYLLFRSQTDPEVIVYTKHDLKRSSIIMLVIENIGKSVAYDVQFSFSEKIPMKAYGFGVIPQENIKWMESGPLILGIPALPPGGTRILDWGQYGGIKSAIGERAVTITAKYKAKKLLSPEPLYCETESKIDIESYAYTVAHDDNEPKKIREELSKIATTLKGLGATHYPINVNISSKQ